MKNILTKYVEIQAEAVSKAIDDFVDLYIPTWQKKVMTLFPFTVALFNWNIVRKHCWSGDNLGESVLELWRGKKLVSTLKIIEKVKIK